jgi:3-deoxy-D-manno-octulosonic-acid transferase
VYLLYSMLTGLALILTLPYWLLKGLRQGKYLHSLRERLGTLPDELGVRIKDRAGLLWIHAVSVGEVLAAAPLAKALKLKFPGRPLVISTTTRTGQQLARERMSFADGFFYFPLDWTFCVRRVFRDLKPSAVIVMETEMWPNFLRVCREHHVPVLLVNGRISPRSFARYQGWLQAFGLVLRPFLRCVFGDVRQFLMQTQEDAERIRALGAASERVSVTGNLKYDQEMPAETAIVRWLRDQVQSRARRPVIVAGSVVAGEERLVLQAFERVRAKWPRALLILAPRKPERFETAAACVEEVGLKFVRRSRLRLPIEAEGALEQGGFGIAEEASVILLDSIGELASLYRIADVVFIGGSLVPSGGHNPLEAAVFGKAPLFGPHTQNFQEITANLIAEGAAMRVADRGELGTRWLELLADDARREVMGARAQAVVERSRGAMAKTLGYICAVLDESSEGKAGQGAMGMSSHGTAINARSARSRE